ncbi:MAG: RNA 2',3'-cyclic phosphodiesterase [Candidatus Daviesbacteria bacterium]|nr:MAG: RNA 2',3'-cyclic phosphodiesterase [Candidatus Daviesbacteria bacterium]
MRFFIALEIPSENRLQFQAIQAKLHTLIPQARLTDLSKIHLTLAFVGEQPNELKTQLVEILQQAGQNISPFEAVPAYIDGFPSLHHPQVLWVGVKGDIDKILLIRERVKDGLTDLHLPIDERRFVPHISIAKLNSDFYIDRNLEVELEKLMAISFDPIKITSIKLFESIPSGGFHKHNTLAEIKLKSNY